jgi:hypothetical protein
MKADFEAAVFIAINKVYLNSVNTGCNFHFDQCPWSHLQNIVLTVEYKENERVRLTRRISAVLAYLPVNKVEEGWLMIMKNVPHFCCPPQTR